MFCFKFKRLCLFRFFMFCLFFCFFSSHCHSFIYHSLIFICTCNLSRLMRKPDFCICKSKDSDQLRSYCAADQRLCFCYIDSTIPLLPKSEKKMAAQPGLCQTWSGTLKTGFLAVRLIGIEGILKFLLAKPWYMSSTVVAFIWSKLYQKPTKIRAGR